MKHSLGVVAAAGFGTRMLPITLAVPKALLPVGVTPLLDFAIAELWRAGIPRVIVMRHAVQSSIDGYLTPHNAIADAAREQSRETLYHQGWRMDKTFHVETFEVQEKASLGHRLLDLVECIQPSLTALTFVDELCDPVLLPWAHMTELAYKYEHSVAAAINMSISSGVLREVPELSVSRSLDRSSQRLIGRFLLNNEFYTALTKMRAMGSEPDFFDGLRLLAQQRRLMVSNYAGNWWDCGSIDGYVSAVTDLGFRASKGEIIRSTQ